MEQRLSRIGGVLYLIIIALRIFGEAFAVASPRFLQSHSIR